jgi:hypothetical protein
MSISFGNLNTDFLALLESGGFIWLGLLSRAAGDFFGSSKDTSGTLKIGIYFLILYHYKNRNYLNFNREKS